MFKGRISDPKFRIKFHLLAFLLVLILLIQATTAFAGGKSILNSEGIVRAVLFFSPTCGHCHKVIEQDLPPIQDKYREQLDILMVDISTPVGRQLFVSAAEYFKDLREIAGVPTLVIGEQVLIGSNEIPEQFPSIIESGLSAGGVDWPAIPGLHENIKPVKIDELQEEGSTSALQTQVQDDIPTTVPVAKLSTGEPASPIASPGNLTEVPGYLQRFLQDPVGNSVAVLTLVGMLVSIVVVGYYFLRTTGDEIQRYPRALSWPGWGIPVLSIIGLGVAGYMSYVEITHVEAICGPLGDCNSVQQSTYATLWGFLPVGILGMIGYLAIGAAWYLYRYGPSKTTHLFALVMWGMALLGTLFSIYLTFLEPFVIGATCAWCISSAVLITMLLWATTGPAIQSMAQDIDEG